MLSAVGQIGLSFGVRRQDSSAFRWDISRAEPIGIVGRLRRWLAPATQPTVFHITHHKAGSQWVNRVLHALAYDRLVLPERDNAQFLTSPIRPGKIYPTVYVTREQFESIDVPANSKRFVVIRDLRDTLISAYFSIKHSHAMEAEEDLRMRDRLHASSFEDGLLYILDDWLPERAAVQQSWLDGPDEVLKYEDMLVRDEEILTRVLLDHCRLDVTREKLCEVILANRFEARAGRKRGAEDVHSHERKGVAGDWRNHFTEKVMDAFKARFGQLLIDTGYERSTAW